MADITEKLQQTVLNAAAEKRALQLIGSGSKTFYGRTPVGEPLVLAEHTGIINYQPKELVITARAGTPLSEIQAALAEQGQMLACEPPQFAEGGTIGGAVAAGLSGPARPYTGSVRDFVLGTRIINGKGEILRFGGEVMKSVAGYALSRLMCGALGTLGLLLDVSIKVMPVNQAEQTRVLTCTESEALSRIAELGRKPLPITAASFIDGQLYLRLSGAEAAVSSAAEQIGGEPLNNAAQFWVELRDFKHEFFQGAEPLWRLSLPAIAPSLQSDGAQLIDWGGAQRWLRGEQDPEQLRSQVAALGGHAVLFRGGDRNSDVFHSLQSALLGFHKKLKQALDPAGIFNPGRLYAEF
ncbi:MAG: glycolate oxidase subunit GlcE [Chromatiales bacterium]|nr:glycolate oxidase subunit GlcE [Chromatiales bacterium]